MVWNGLGNINFTLPGILTAFETVQLLYVPLRKLASHSYQEKSFLLFLCDLTSSF